MKIFITVFSLGLLIQTAAFFVNQVENIPFVVNLISPKYSHAVKGLRRLESSMLIEPTDKGFSEFQEIFLDLLREQNSLENVASISVLKFQREGARMTFSQKRTKEVIPIKVFVSNRQEISWNLEDLTNRIEKFKKKNTFVISIIIFVFGASIQIIGFFIGFRKA